MEPKLGEDELDVGPDQRAVPYPPAYSVSPVGSSTDLRTSSTVVSYCPGARLQPSSLAMGLFDSLKGMV